MKNKKQLIISLLLLMALLLAACGQPETDDREYAAREFLTQLLNDDTELQQAILENVTVIGEGVSAPTAEGQAAREDRKAALTELVENRFGGLASPELIARSAKDGSLTQWQSLFAFSGAKAYLRECSFRQEDGRTVFEATVHCVNGEEEADLPLQGEVVFSEDGLIDSFSLYEDESGFTGWLRAQDAAALQEYLNQMTAPAGGK